MRRTALTAGIVAFSAMLTLPSVGLAAADDPRLVDAVEHREHKLVAALLKQGVDVNRPQSDGATALHWAAHWDDLPTVDQLLRAGAQVNAVNDYGVTPLSLAATNGSAAMVRRLLEAGAGANAVLPTGETVLMTAAHAGNVDVVAALLAAGAQVNAVQASKGQSALMWAISERHLEIVRMLLDAGADPRARTKAGFSPLLFAAREGDLEIVRLLLAQGADVNRSADDGSTPLLVATVRGHVDLALLLLDRGAMPEGDAAVAGYTPLHWAAGKAEALITFYYPDAPGEWKAFGGIPSREGKLNLMRALLAHGANVNARLTKNVPRYGFTRFKSNYQEAATPFFLATMVADVEVMRFLLANGADPTMNAKDGTTPFIVAAGMARMENESNVAESERLAAMSVMLALGANIDETNAFGLSAMHAAALAGYEKVVQFLADRGAQLNQKTKNGQTPLGVAEGELLTGSFGQQPHTAALLRKLGAVSEGAVTLGLTSTTACGSGAACVTPPREVVR